MMINKEKLSGFMNVMKFITAVFLIVFGNMMIVEGSHPAEKSLIFNDSSLFLVSIAIIMAGLLMVAIGFVWSLESVGWL